MKIKNILIAGSVCFFAMTACTNVEENVYDKYQPDEFYGSP